MPVSQSERRKFANFSQSQIIFDFCSPAYRFLDENYLSKVRVVSPTRDLFMPFGGLAQEQNNY